MYTSSDMQTLPPPPLPQFSYPFPLSQLTLMYPTSWIKKGTIREQRKKFFFETST